jgi:hypothetical protein
MPVLGWYGNSQKKIGYQWELICSKVDTRPIIPVMTMGGGPEDVQLGDE